MDDAHLRRLLELLDEARGIVGVLVQPPAQSTANPTGLAITMALGSPGLNIEVGAVEPAGFSIGLSLGTPSADSTILISATGLSSSVGLGTPSVTIDEVANASVSTSGFPMSASLGTPSVSTAPQFTSTWGENSTDTHGGVTRDTRFRAGSPDTNYGTSDALFTEWDGDNVAEWTSVLRFDLSALPSDAIISSATIRLTTLSVVPSQSVVIHGYECLRNDWIVLEATWNIWKTGSGWATAGARGANTDVTGTPASTSGSKMTWTVPAATPANTAITSTDFASYLQTLVTGGQGFINLALHNEALNGQHIAPYSSRGTDGNRPNLSVTFTSATYQPPASEGPGATGQFVMHTDGKCYDPNGSEFRIHGVNIFPTDSSATHVNAVVDSWKFNFVVVKWMGFDDTWPDHTQSQIEAMVDAYTARNVVCMIQRAGESAQELDAVVLAQTRAAFAPLITKYASNPYVWWAGKAEPYSDNDAVNYGGVGGSTWNQTTIDEWLFYFNTLASDIRNGGSQSPIAVAPPIFGQDGLRPSFGAGIDHTIPIEERYAGIKYWDDLNFTNKFIEVHPYKWWNDTQTRFNEYFDEHKARGICVDMGDLISNLNGGDFERNPTLMNYAMAALSVGRAIGSSFWHWNHGGASLASPRNNLTIPTGVANGSGNGHQINDPTNPTNLSSDFGQIIWDVKNSTTTTGPGATGIYFVHTDGKIYDPQGAEFRVIGGNFEHNKLPAATNLQYMGDPGWRLNTIRMYNLTHPTTFGDTDESISDAHLNSTKILYWTPAMEVGGFATSGGSGIRNLTTLSNYIGEIAQKYGTTGAKANERMWYGIYNEPGSFSTDTDATLSGGQIVWNASRVNDWTTMISTIVNRVRSEGARAPIIVPTMVGCQDIARVSGGNAFNFPVGDRSAILKHATQILNAVPTVTGNNGAQTKNLIFAVHLYSNYKAVTFSSGGTGKTAGALAQLEEFLTECASRGISIIFEEFGLFLAGAEDTRQATRNMHAARYAGHYFGEIVWDWDAGDNNNLTLTDSGCEIPAGASNPGTKCGTCNYAASVTKRCSGPDINSLTSPTNLTLSGRVLWDSSHPGTFPPPQ